MRLVAGVKHSRLNIVVFSLFVALLLFVSSCVELSNRNLAGMAWQPGDSYVNRTMPSRVAPNSTFIVNLSVVVTEPDTWYTILEQLQFPLVIVNTSANTTNNGTNTMYWNISSGSPLPSTIYSYTLRAPATPGNYSFTGNFLFQGTTLNETSQIFGPFIIEVAATCGNGVVEGSEQCDGSTNNQTCPSIGYLSGSLSCTAACIFNTTTCNNATSVYVDSTFASSQYDKNNLVDGRLSIPLGAPSWASTSSGSATHWVELNFTQTRYVGGVNIWWAWNGAQAMYMTSQQVDVQYWNGATYSTIASIVPGVQNSTNSSLSFSPVNTTSLRFWQPANMGPLTYLGIMWLTETNYTTAVPNSAPVASSVVLSSSSGSNYDRDNLSVTFTSSDVNGDAITNITDWRKNGQSFAVINMPFDTNTVSTSAGAVRDYSTYGNAGTLGAGTASNVPSWTSAGKLGGAYLCDGINDYIQIPRSASWETQNITYMAWVKPGFQNNTYGVLWAIGNSRVRLLLGNDNFIHFDVEPRHVNAQNSNIPWTPDVWQHVVLKSVNGTTSIFKNGLKYNFTNVGSGFINYSISPDNIQLCTRIGGLNLNGSIDAFKLFPVALSDEQILAIYNAENAGYDFKQLASNETTVGEQWTCAVTPNDKQSDGSTVVSNALTIIADPVNVAPVVSGVTLSSSSGQNKDVDNLSLSFTSSDANGDYLTNITDWRVNGQSLAVLNMPFDTNTMSNATGAVKDYSIYGNNGTLGKGVAAQIPAWISGTNIGGAYRFDGVNDYMYIPNSPSVDVSGSLSFEMWITPLLRGNTADDVVFAKPWDEDSYGAGDYQYAMEIYYPEAQAHCFYGNGSTPGGPEMTLPVALANNTMYHIVCTFNGTQWRGYVNGALVATQVQSFPLQVRGTGILVGRGPISYPQYFSGILHDFKIYNRALSPEQISRNYQDGINSVYGRTLVGNETLPGEIWTSAVTPNDRQLDGTTVLSNAITISGCGNGNIDVGEQCDGSNFNGSSCISMGYVGGNLSCTLLCQINTSACTSSAYGNLTVSMIAPAVNTNVLPNSFFNVTARVTCTGGICGNVQAILDPILGNNNFTGLYPNDTDYWPPIPANGKMGGRFKTPNVSGTLDNITAVLTFQVDRVYSYAIYTDNNGQPGMKIAEKTFNYTSGYPNYKGFGRYTDIAAYFNGEHLAANAYYWLIVGVDGLGSSNFWYTLNMSGTSVNGTGSPSTDINFGSYTLGTLAKQIYANYTADATVKGVVPMFSGSPFYTIDTNPVSSSCLLNMINGSTCDVTWRVNASGSSGTFPFFATFLSLNYPSSVAARNTSFVNITIQQNYGNLTATLLSPTVPGNLTPGQLFNVTARVTCTGSAGAVCGDIRATLDPILGNPTNPNPHASGTNVKRCGIFYLNETALVKNITRYGYSSSSASCAAAIYNSTNSVPDTLIVQSGMQPESSSVTWTTYPVPDTLLSSGYYAVCALCNGSLTFYSNDSGGIIRGNNDVYPYDIAFGSTLFNNSVYNMTIYANYLLGPTAVKGVIPMNAGTPFYTIDTNPVSSSCLLNMNAGSTCDLTWRVNTTGNNGTYAFFVSYDPVTYSANIPGTNTPTVLLTIQTSSNTPPTIQSLSMNPATIYTKDDVVCSFTAIDGQQSTLTATAQWYKNGTLAFSQMLSNIPNGSVQQFTLPEAYTNVYTNITCLISLTDGITNTSQQTSKLISAYATTIAVSGTNGSVGQMLSFKGNYSSSLFGDVGQTLWRSAVLSGKINAVKFYDCNGDGKKRCIAVGPSGTNLNLYNYTFQPIASPSLSTITTIEPYNLVGDAKEELGITSSGGGIPGLYVFYANGTKYWDVGGGATYERFGSVAFGDITGDGTPEVVGGQSVASYTFAYDRFGNMLWNYSDSSGQFYEVDIANFSSGKILFSKYYQPLILLNSLGQHVWNSSTSSCTNARSQALIQLDADANLEFICGNTMSIFDDTGNVLFGSLANDLAYDIGVADIDNDNKQDIIFVWSTSPSIEAWTVNSTSRTQKWNYSYASFGGYPGYNLIPADINDDGRKEIILGGADNYTTILSSSGTLIARIPIFGSLGRGDYQTTGKHPALDAGDVNGDGILDFLVGSGDNTTYLFQDVTCAISFNDSLAGNMTWNITEKKWIYERNFSSNGFFSYTISCSKNGYAPQSAAGQIFVNASVSCTDADGDGYNTTTGICGAVADCNDSNILEKPNQIWYNDQDGDNYGNATTLVQCLRPAGYKALSELVNTTDCNNTNSSINPGAAEICTDGIDNNCNNQIDYDMSYGVHGDPACLVTLVTMGIAGGNTTPLENTIIKPICTLSSPLGYMVYSVYATIDGQGCILDKANSSNSYQFNCSVGAYTGSNKTLYCLVNLSMSYSGNPNVSRQISPQQNCTTVWYRDFDNDTFGNVSSTQIACSQPAGYVNNSLDCNDANNFIRPGQTEICNLVDDNCNGQSDEGLTNYTYFRDFDNDTYGNKSVNVTACGQPAGYVLNNSLDCNDNNGAVNPGAGEICTDGIDNNCNNETDYDNRYGVHGDAACPVNLNGIGIVGNSTPLENTIKQLICTPSNISSYQVNSISGKIDNQSCLFNSYSANNYYFNCSVGPYTGSNKTLYCSVNTSSSYSSVSSRSQQIFPQQNCTTVWYRDFDNDTYGNVSSTQVACSKPVGYVNNSADCNDANATIKPGATEICDGFDNNCNAQTDEGNTTLCTDGVYCNGLEYCGGVLGCRPGTSINTSDGVACTVDTCIEGSNTTTHVANNSYCNDGLYCNGAETCNILSGCVNGTAISCAASNTVVNTCTYNPDNVNATFDNYSFTSLCNEANDSCTIAPANWTSAITHTCSMLSCGAQCESAANCSNMCIGNVYYSGASCNATSCACSYGSSLNCSLQNGWYNATNKTNVSTGSCTQKEQVLQYYRTYSCGGFGCTYINSSSQWVDTGNTSFKPVGTICDDGLWCTGAVNDACAAGGICTGTARNCGDAYSCTSDSCNEANDTCVNFQNDTLCTAPAVCNTAYFPNGTGCGNITADCAGKPNGVLCNDGIYCNGPDWCQSNNCVNAGPPINVNDGVACTIDSCVEGTNITTHTVNNSYCNNGLYCDGTEYCDAALGCRNGTSIDCTSYNLPPITNCAQNDTNPWTLDTASGFTSSCINANSSCTQGGYTFTHTCDVTACGAQCDSTHLCNDSDPGTIDTCLGNCSCQFIRNCTDADGDGFNATGGSCGSLDCNDNNANITQYTYYYDDDADGYGVATNFTLTCAPSGKYTASVSGDCNDNNASINPLATEVCNGVDDNCDSFTDRYANGSLLTQSYYTANLSTLNVGVCRAGLQTCVGATYTTTIAQTIPSNETCDQLDNNCDAQIDESFACGYVQLNTSAYQQLNQPIVNDPAGVTLAMPITLLGSSGVYSATVFLQGWYDVDPASVAILENGVSVSRTYNQATGAISWLSNLSNSNVSLRFKVPAPTYNSSYENESLLGNSTKYYLQNFSIKSKNHLTNIRATIPVKLGYQDWQLRDLDLNDNNAQNTYGLVFLGDFVTFSGFNTSNRTFQLIGQTQSSNTTGLSISSDADVATIYVGQPLTYYASYTDKTNNNTFINNGICFIYHDGLSDVMDRNSTLKRYTFTSLGYASKGYYTYTIQCAAPSFDTRIAFSQATITPVCGDAVCDADFGETCSTCGSDCGACPTNANTPGGGGPGGGGPSGPIAPSTTTTSAEVKTAVFDFDGALYRASITYNSTLAMNLTRELKNESIPDVNVYAMYNLVPSFAFMSSTLEFKVAKSWVESHNIDITTIALKTKTTDWRTVPSILAKQDDSYYYYKASANTLGWFAITAVEKNKEGREEKPLPVENQPNSPNGLSDETTKQVFEKPGNTLNFFIYAGIILLMISGLATFFYWRAHHLIGKEHLDVIDQKLGELRQYVQVELENGQTAPHIKETLLNTGWKQSIVDKVVDETVSAMDAVSAQHTKTAETTETTETGSKKIMV